MDRGKNILVPADSSEDEVTVDKYQALVPIPFLSYDEIINLKYEDEDSFYQWFNAHALHVGFSVRKDTLLKVKDTDIPFFRRYVCCREGFREHKHMLRTDFDRGPRPLSRVGCPVKLEIKLDTFDGFWKVHAFQDIHNHDLALDDEIAFLRSQRKIDDPTKLEINELIDSGSRRCKIRDYIELQKGGYLNMGFTSKDLYNKTYREERKRMESGDANTVLNTLRERKLEDPNYFFEHEIDELGRLKHLFVVDSQSLLDYRAFGDVVIFDSTYRTNCYNMPFVPFVGVNHHRKTVLFGCGILSDETVSSFTWLLCTFMKAHKQKTPISIVTDGDHAMQKAISDVLPGTKYRTCLWHLAKNIYKNISNRELIAGICALMFENCTPDEFEMRWANLVNEHKISNKSYLADLYRRRKHWAEAYLHNCIFLGIRSNQRSESMNSKFRGYLARSMTLVRMLQHYERCVTRMRCNEAADDYKASQTVPFTPYTASLIEKHAASTYTETMFKYIQTELIRTCDYMIVHMEQISDITVEYVVTRIHNNSRIYQVRYIQKSNTKEMSCTCVKLKTQGIPCRHILLVLYSIGEPEIPQGVIWTRWTKHAKLGLMSDRHAGSRYEKIERSRYRALYTKGTRLFMEAAKNEANFKEMVSMLDDAEILTNLKQIDLEQDTPHADHDKLILHKHIESRGVLDPECVTTKGAPRRRQKSFMEKRNYKCSVCHEIGHTKRNCKLLEQIHALAREAEPSHDNPQMEVDENQFQTPEKPHYDWDLNYP